jgi:UDP-2-acetamido-3-amino-2,3-dideoxy-glucuronate N-acetyltransferase
MTARPSVAVIGGGYWGKNLIRNFYELGSLAMICDTNTQLLREYKEKYSGVAVTDDYKDLLKASAVKAAVIALPAAEHYRFAKMFMENGKDVFVEKPLALKVEEAEELVEIARKKKKILMVGHILQYHPAVIKLKEMVDNGKMGKIQYIYSRRTNMGKIRSEENILWSFAPHDISTILMLLGEMPEKVITTGGSYLQHNVVDVTLSSFEFKNGVRAHIFVSWLHPFKEQKLVVIGSKQMAVFDDTIKDKLVVFPHKIDWQNRVPVAQKAESEVVTLDGTEEPLKAECRHFLDCLAKRGQPKTDGTEGVEVLKVLNACQESINKNGATVTLTAGKTKDYFAHHSAVIDEGTEIGAGTTMWHFTHVLKGSKIGKNCRIGQNVVVGPNAVVGSNCKIQNNVSIYEGVVLEDDVFCGPSMVFTNVINPRSAVPRMNELRKTICRKGSTIGANATIVCGHNLGKHAFIGAGAVVTKDVPDFALMVGNPARQIGWMCECGEKIDFKGKNQTQCSVCKKKFQKKGDKVMRRA